MQFKSQISYWSNVCYLYLNLKWNFQNKSVFCHLWYHISCQRCILSRCVYLAGEFANLIQSRFSQFWIDSNQIPTEILRKVFYLFHQNEFCVITRKEVEIQIHFQDLLWSKGWVPSLASEFRLVTLRIKFQLLAVRIKLQASGFWFCDSKINSAFYVSFLF